MRTFRHTNWRKIGISSLLMIPSISPHTGAISYLLPLTKTRKSLIHHFFRYYCRSFHHPLFPPTCSWRKRMLRKAQPPPKLNMVHLKIGPLEKEIPTFGTPIIFRFLFWLVVSTHLKNISQNGSFPQGSGVKIKNWVATTQFCLPSLKRYTNSTGPTSHQLYAADRY